MKGMLAGRVAWVTGGSSGIGQAVADMLRSHGALVGILDVAEPEDRYKWEHCNLADPSSVARASLALSSRIGRADVLVCCAGINASQSVIGHPTGLWQDVLATNLSGAFYAIRACLPEMICRGWGRIVTLSSGGAVRVLENRAAYAASKAGLVALTRSVALESAKRGVTVNSIAPGLTDTPMAAKVYTGSASDAAAGDTTVSNPMGVLLEPADIAHGVEYLCSPGARYVTGQLIHINAGSVM